MGRFDRPTLHQPGIQSNRASAVAGDALHDLALHVVREHAAVARDIGGDLAVGAPLLAGLQAFVEPAPKSLALGLPSRAGGIGKMAA